MHAGDAHALRQVQDSFTDWELLQGVLEQPRATLAATGCLPDWRQHVPVHNQGREADHDRVEAGNVMHGHDAQPLAGYVADLVREIGRPLACRFPSLSAAKRWLLCRIARGRMLPATAEAMAAATLLAGHDAEASVLVERRGVVNAELARSPALALGMHTPIVSHTGPRRLLLLRERRSAAEAPGAAAAGKTPVLLPEPGARTPASSVKKPSRRRAIILYSVLSTKI